MGSHYDGRGTSPLARAPHRGTEGRKALPSSTSNLAEKDAALANRVEKPRLPRAKQVPRQHVKHRRGQLRRREDLIRRQVGEARENVGIVAGIGVKTSPWSMTRWREIAGRSFMTGAVRTSGLATLPFSGPPAPSRGGSALNIRLCRFSDIRLRSSEGAWIWAPSRPASD